VHVLPVDKNKKSNFLSSAVSQHNIAILQGIALTGAVLTLSPPRDGCEMLRSAYLYTF